MKPRESRYVKVARIAYHLTQHTLPRYSHPKSPHHFTLPQPAAGVWWMFYLDLSYRDMEEWLPASDQICRELELSRIPDHTTLQRTYQKLRMPDFEKMKNRFLDENEVDEEGIASDSTGFSPGQASLYDQTCTGRYYQHWVKGGHAVGILSQFILAWRSGWGPGSDGPYLPGLRRDARRYGRYRGKRKAWAMLADSGFDGRTVRDDDLIPPVRRGGHLVNPERRARADWVSQARLEDLFGQRWKTETVNSVIKRKFGDALRSRKCSPQRRAPIVKGLV